MASPNEGEITSRLFVKNLPKHATEETLRQHLASKGGVITDVKVLKNEATGKSRQTAFVGFRTVEDALQAKQYFDKTFLHTSRILIEFAKPVGDPSLQHKSRKNVNKEVAINETPEPVSAKKREREERLSKKKEEFMNLIKPKAAEFWSNEAEEDVTADDVETGEAGLHAEEEKDKFREEKSQVNPPVVATSNRLFLRNLPYSTRKDDLMEAFEKFSPVDVILPQDELQRSKGFAIMKFPSEDLTSAAMIAMDRRPFQGRLLHVIPADAERPNAKDGDGTERKDYKSAKEEERRKNAGSKSDQRSWHSLFIRGDAAAGAVAKQLGVSKRELILGGGDDDDAAVRVAMSEAKVIAEGKAFLEENGVDVSVLEASLRGEPVKHSDSVLLVKNLPDTTIDHDLRPLFAKQGQLERFVMPPSRTMALVSFYSAESAKKAMSNLAYSRYKNVPLYIQFAPDNIITKKTAVEADVDNPKHSPAASKEPSEDTIQGQRVLFIKNLEFSVKESELDKHVTKVCGLRPQHVSIPKRRGKNGELLSSGFGFAQFADEPEASSALKKLQGSELKGHTMDVKLSHNASSGSGVTTTTASGPTQQEKSGSGLPTKIIVRNLAFEATKRDVKKLFDAHAEVKSVRLPKKMDGSTRGFAFVEFSSHLQAKNAIQALGAAHLYGRRLVAEFTNLTDAEVHEDDAVDQRKRMRGSAE